MHFLQILILAVVQGACELLPVSSSAHVIIAEKLMGLDPASPEMTMLLVMLHTGTMFAVIAYFWNSWRRDYFSSGLKGKDFIVQIIAATACTGIVGYGVKVVIEKVFMRGMQKAEIEDLFANLPLIAGALFAVGLLIIYAGFRSDRSRRGSEIQLPESCWIGMMQGLCLPFRGFSRSGATISTGLILGVSRRKLEEFSFALAVVLTPPVIAREALRLLKANKEATIHIPILNLLARTRFYPQSTGTGATIHIPILHLLAPSLIGMLFSFLAGLLALKWLSHWLEAGQWKFFGFYCIFASLAVLGLHYGMGL